MCGIAGIFNFNKQLVRQEQLQRMTNKMINRGPDDQGFYLSNSLGLGFRRLSIIDLEGGHQPLSNENETIQLICNGEIYNHIELRQQLTSEGHAFKTQSDAEVLIHLYEKKREKALDDVNGMFAFALFDKNKNSIWIARDRLGIKPLYYVLTADQLIFASSSSAIRAVFPTSLDPQGLNQYLALAYVPDPNSIWKNIKKLPPASYLIASNSGNIKYEKYWTLGSVGNWHGSLQEAKDKMDGMLANAINLQMRSDVPVGIFLSGGVDSSAIASYAAQLTKEPLRAYTINFEGKKSTDAKYAKLMADNISANHFEVSMDVKSAALALDNLVKYLDEPIADSAIIPAYVISKFAQAQGVKVLLNGAGGDEIFGGYARHLPPIIGSPKWVSEILPHSPRTAILNILQFLSPYRSSQLAKPTIAWARNISGIDISMYKKILRDKSACRSLTDIIDKEFEVIAKSKKEKSYSHDRMDLDIKTYLPSDVLALIDKASMAASVECRVPLLDHRLVELAYSLPISINMLEGKPKGLFKEVLNSRLPRILLENKKEGFNAPIDVWMKKKGSQLLQDKLFMGLAPKIMEYIDPEPLKDLLKRNHSSELLFSILMLNCWYKAQV